MEVAENIHMFLGRSNPIESNCYLILGEQKFLVDTGLSEDILFRNIESVNVALTDIDLIINTHCHFDHIKSNKILKNCAHAKLAAHEPDSLHISTADPEFIASKQREFHPLKRVVKHKGNSRVSKTDFSIHESTNKPSQHATNFNQRFLTFSETSIEPVSVDINLDEGDKIGDFEVIHSPGHTKGSICLLNKAQGILITGDTLFADGFVGRTDLPSGNKEELIKSIKKFEKLDLDKILPGHEKPVLTGANENVKRALEILGQTSCD